MVASLVEKRLSDPEHVGPHYWPGSKELPSDVLVSLAEDADEFRKKLVPAVRILLYHVLHDDKDSHKNSMVKSLFDLIKDVNIAECGELVYGWLKEHYSLLLSKRDSERELYRAALCCFARVQPVNTVIELFWSNIWLNADSYWWAVAFLGLRVQNPELACTHLPLFTSRKLTTAHNILSGMWSDINCRPAFIDALKRGLRATSGWAGIAINETYGILQETERKMLLATLHDTY